MYKVILAKDVTLKTLLCLALSVSYSSVTVMLDNIRSVGDIDNCHALRKLSFRDVT